MGSDGIYACRLFFHHGGGVQTKLGNNLPFLPLKMVLINLKSQYAFFYSHSNCYNKENCNKIEKREH